MQQHFRDLLDSNDKGARAGRGRVQIFLFFDMMFCGGLEETEKGRGKSVLKLMTKCQITCMYIHLLRLAQTRTNFHIHKQIHKHSQNYTQKKKLTHTRTYKNTDHIETNKYLHTIAQYTRAHIKQLANMKQSLLRK